MTTLAPSTSPAEPAKALPPAVRIGDFTVTALADGFFDIPAPFLMKDGQPLANGPETLRLEINGFLVTTPSRTILIDTGCGSLLGPTVNNLVDQLAIAGKSPLDVDAVLCTHIHPDHTNGLVDASGAAQFANAQVFAPRNDLDFWLSDEEMGRAPEALRIQFQWAQRAFAPYAGRIAPFDGGEIIDGIEALPLFGHTPGHSGFHLDGGGNSQLIIWGDAVHDIAVQTRDPDVTVVADLDPDQARLVRHQIFDRVAADDALFAGMHVGFPGFGRLARSAGRFDYEVVGQAR